MHILRSRLHLTSEHVKSDRFALILRLFLWRRDIQNIPGTVRRPALEIPIPDHSNRHRLSGAFTCFEQTHRQLLRSSFFLRVLRGLLVEAAEWRLFFHSSLDRQFRATVEKQKVQSACLKSGRR